jgi:hypothetical protein
MNRTDLDPENHQSAYEIFKKDSSGNPIWMETVFGLDQARKRLISMAAYSPGEYLAFDPVTHSFVDIHANTKSA